MSIQVTINSLSHFCQLEKKVICCHVALDRHLSVTCEINTVTNTTIYFVTRSIVLISFCIKQISLSRVAIAEVLNTKHCYTIIFRCRCVRKPKHSTAVRFHVSRLFAAASRYRLAELFPACPGSVQLTYPARRRL